MPVYLQLVLATQLESQPGRLAARAPSPYPKRAQKLHVEAYNEKHEKVDLACTGFALSCCGVCAAGAGWLCGACGSWPVGLLLELERLCAERTGRTEDANASRSARRRKEYIGIGLPPREYGSTPPRLAALPPIGIKTSWGSLVLEPVLLWTRAASFRHDSPPTFASQSFPCDSARQPDSAPGHFGPDWRRRSSGQRTRCR